MGMYQGKGLIFKYNVIFLACDLIFLLLGCCLLLCNCMLCMRIVHLSECFNQKYFSPIQSFAILTPPICVFHLYHLVVVFLLCIVHLSKFFKWLFSIQSSATLTPQSVQLTCRSRIAREWQQLQGRGLWPIQSWFCHNSDKPSFYL